MLTIIVILFTLKSHRSYYTSWAVGGPPTVNIPGTKGHRTHRKRSAGPIGACFSGGIGLKISRFATGERSATLVRYVLIAPVLIGVDLGAGRGAKPVTPPISSQKLAWNHDRHPVLLACRGAQCSRCHCWSDPAKDHAVTCGVGAGTADLCLPWRQRPAFKGWGLFPVGVYLLGAGAIRWLDGLAGRTTSLALIAGNAWFFWDLAAEIFSTP